MVAEEAMLLLNKEEAWQLLAVIVTFFGCHSNHFNTGCVLLRWSSRVV